MLVSDIPLWPECPYAIEPGMVVRRGKNEDGVGIVCLHDPEWDKQIVADEDKLTADAFALMVKMLIDRRRATGWGWREDQLRLRPDAAWKFANRAGDHPDFRIDDAPGTAFCVVDGYEVWLDQDSPADVSAKAERIAAALLAKRGL